VKSIKFSAYSFYAQITPEMFLRVMLRLSNAGLIEVNGREIVITKVAE